MSTTHAVQGAAIINAKLNEYPSPFILKCFLSQSCLLLQNRSENFYLLLSHLMLFQQDTACSSEALTHVQGTVLQSSTSMEGMRLEYPLLICCDIYIHADLPFFYPFLEL